MKYEPPKVGQKFGKLVVEDVKGAMTLCRCECGDRRYFKQSRLLNGNHVSCGKCMSKYFGLDISGRRFGFLTAIRPNNGYSQWVAVCDCGNEVMVPTGNLLSTSKSCGCMRVDALRDVARQRTGNIAGRQFGRLKAIRFAGYKNHRAYWCCRCDCCPECKTCDGAGCSVRINASSLLAGRSKSCGCSQSAFAAEHIRSVIENRKQLCEESREGCTPLSRPHYRMTPQEACGILGIGETDLHERFLRPGVIRSKKLKTKGVMVSANDVAAYIAELQREARACPLGKITDEALPVQ